MRYIINKQLNMKKYLIYVMTGLVALVGCQPPDCQDPTPIDYDSIQVNFALAGSSQSWDEGATFAIIATCTRDGKPETSMSANQVAKYTIAGSNLKAVSEADKVMAFQGDHNYNFVCIYPYPAEEGVNLNAIPLEAPKQQNYSSKLNPPQFAIKKVITVAPTVEFALTSVFSSLDFYVPNDINEGFETTVKTLDIKAQNVDLSVSGVLNAYTGEFSKTGSSNEITVDFGSGFTFTDAYTKVSVLAAPFTIPEGGLDIVFNNVDQSQLEIKALNADTEVGKTIAAGASYTSYLSGISDGIIPVTFPVIFPMGPHPDGKGYNDPSRSWTRDWVNDPACVNSTRTSENWTGPHGTLYCMDQPQASLKWVWDSKIATVSSKYYIESANTLSRGISVIGVKGIWTDDYFEFEIPVRKFAAGTKLQLRMPIYTRTGPTFWEVLYKDGEDWKTTAKNAIPALEGSDVSRVATWAVPYLALDSGVDNEQSVVMTFDRAVKSGKIYIRVKCVDGTIVSQTATSVATVAKPNVGAPFYFYNPAYKTKEDQHIHIEML